MRDLEVKHLRRWAHFTAYSWEEEHPQESLSKWDKDYAHVLMNLQLSPEAKKMSANLLHQIRTFFLFVLVSGAEAEESRRIREECKKGC